MKREDKGQQSGGPDAYREGETDDERNCIARDHMGEGSDEGDE
jgi:hypothetical protein